MAITDTQKVDYLFKKLGFGVTKTDTNTNKVAANESIPSPLLLRGDKVWQQSSSIPTTKPSSTGGVVQVYSGASTVECIVDITASNNRTWKTGLTDWITPEFGSTYLVNVYVHTSGDAANAESSGTKLFITGSGNDDEWFFDYQSGVLHFIGSNLPNGINFTGKSIYITGARYVGILGVGSTPGEDASLGNLLISNTTISSVNTNDNIILDPNGSGQLVIDGSNAVTIPSGTTVERPAGTLGDIRINSDTGNFEYYNGTSWQVISPTVNISTIDNFNGDGSTVLFTLNESTTSAGTIVTLNGVVQSPGNAYNVSGTSLTFTEAPKIGDDIEVRYISTSFNVGNIISDFDSSIQVNDGSSNIVSKINGSNVVVTTDTSTTFNGSIFGIGSISSITTSVPSSSSDTGTKGEIAYDSNYVYICVGTNTWIRSSIQNTF